jgi:hypothetical protein
MNNHDYSKHLANAARVAVALCALAALGGRAAQAQAITPFSFTGDASQLGAGAFTIDNPTGDPNSGLVNSPFTVTGGGLQVTFTALNGTPGQASFEAFDNPNGEFDFPIGTNLINTFDMNNITGPLEIDFSQGVSAFGLRAQDAAFDRETFTVTATDQNGNNFAFVSPTVDQTNTAMFPAGRSVFLGAQGTGGDLITKVVISSLSTVINKQGMEVPTTSSNDFYFSPISLRSAPVPEASTLVGSGMGLFLFAGLIWSANKRRVSCDSQSAPQTAG